MIPRPWSSATIAIASLLMAGVSHAPRGQSQTFRTRIEVVRTDVTVVDNRTGRPITGLTASDFAIAEDGVPQTITTFIAEQGEALGTVEPDGRPAGRSFLVVLGTGTRGVSDPYGAIARFLRTRLRGTDRAAVMVWDRVTPFTMDFEALAKLVERGKQIPVEVQSRTWVDSRGGSGYRPDTRVAIDRWLLPEGEPRDFLRPVAPAVTDGFGTEAHIWDRLDSTIAQSNLLKVTAGIELLRRQPGERRLVLVSTIGLAIPIEIKNFPMLRNSDDERALTQRAADAGVALDLITTYGTMHPPSLSWNLALMAAQSVAAETGGEFTSLRTTEQQLARIDETSRYGYIIGYEPQNPAADGKRRRVSISVNRKDVTLVYRRGYTARLDLPPVDWREQLSRSRIDDAAAASMDLDGVGVKASARRLGGSPLQVQVEIAIDARDLALSTRNGQREGTIDLTVLCGNSRQQVIGKVAQQMTLGLDETRYQQVLKTGIPYTVVIPVQGQAAFAKVVVYSFDDDRLGSVTVQVR